MEVEIPNERKEEKNKPCSNKEEGKNKQNDLDENNEQKEKREDEKEKKSINKEEQEEEEDEEEEDEKEEEELKDEKEKLEQKKDKEKEKPKNKKKKLDKSESLYDGTIKNIKLKNSNITCYIGNEANKKASKELYDEIKKIPLENITLNEQMKAIYQYGNNQIIYYNYPLFEKKIKIYNSKGNQFKAIIYFIEDIQNIVKFLKMKNPHYFDKSTNNYLKLSSDYDYSMFLLGKENEILKDISYSSVKYKKLKHLYKKKRKN